MLASLISVPRVHQASALPLSYTKAQFYSVYVPVHVPMCVRGHTYACAYMYRQEDNLGFHFSGVIDLDF